MSFQLSIIPEQFEPMWNSRVLDDILFVNQAVSSHVTGPGMDDLLPTEIQLCMRKDRLETIVVLILERRSMNDCLI